MTSMPFHTFFDLEPTVLLTVWGTKTMKRLVMLLAILVLIPVGCASAPESKPKTLKDWGKLSRPKF
jgi:hypothetical protein